MNNKKLTVTIGIPAYNEAKNIKNLLKSIIRQEEKDYQIKKIIVISDGSTDNTVKKAKEIKDNRLIVYNYKKRIGKSTHLNTLFNKLDTDLIALFDADVTLADKGTIHYLIQPFKANKKISLTGGSPTQFTQKTYLEKALKNSFNTYKELRLGINDGNNLYCCIGQILCLRRNFAKKIKVPKDIMCNDTFIYLSCLKNNFKFKYVDEAKVFYLAPDNIRDQISQNARFKIAKNRLIKLFGQLAINEYFIPKNLLYFTLLKGFIKSPLLSSLLFILNTYSNFIVKFKSYKFGPTWPIAWSTKEEIKFLYDK